MKTDPTVDSNKNPKRKRMRKGKGFNEGKFERAKKSYFGMK